MAIVVIVLGLLTAWAIGYMYVMFLRVLLAKPNNRPNVYDLVPRMPKYNPDDYWNDAGDGSGVNYVQMPDGSVRID